MAGPSSIRFDDAVSERLTAYVARHPGSTRSSTAARYVDEGLRMDEHPGILFREGPTGRRATVTGGPDVWEVVRAVKAARAAEPEMSSTELMSMLEDNTGVPGHMIRTAIDYWASYPDEVEALVEHADRAEARRRAAAERASTLLDR
jgi:hypothetical protein